MDDRQARFAPLVARVLAAAASPASTEISERIAAWLAAVDDWNRKMDLTSARDERELVDVMVADAAVLAPHLPSGARVVDVGTGAGAPGLPLALLRADVAVTLVEPKQKRTALLRSVLGRFAVADGTALGAEVVQARAAELTGRAFDVALSRATLAPAEWLALGAELAPRGEVWVLLARQTAPALSGWSVVHELSYEWPLTAAPRRAVCYRRG